MRQVATADVPGSRFPGAPSLPVMVIGIFAVTLLAYFPALRGAVLWDDEAHITAPALQSIHGLWEIWFKLGATQQYYPMLHTAFWVEHRLWGDATPGYHLLNVGLHATAACLFGVVLARLRHAGAVVRPPVKTEWLAAALFALHPVCVESVAWISEQKNTLSLVFYLLAALTYLRFDRERSWRWYGLSTGLFVFALLTKSVTATLPAALLLSFYWQRGRLEWKRDCVPLLPWFGLGIGAGILTAWVEQHFIISAQGAPYALTALQRGFLAGRIIWFYLGKLFWPANLIFIYPHWSVGTDLLGGLGSLAFAGAVGVTWGIRRWSRGPLVALLFFAGSLFPALGFIAVFPFQFSYVADHWQYLPCLGIIALIALGGEAMTNLRVTGALPAKVSPTFHGGFIATAVLSVFFFLTWRQSHLYHSVEILYQETLRKNPECWLARNNLGLLRLEEGKVVEAIDDFKTALRIKPDCADAYNNLGNAYVKISGHARDAIAAFEQALRYYPGMAEAHANLGWALVNEPGRFDEGVVHLQEALRLQPDLCRAHNSLGLAWGKMPNRFVDALAEFESALACDPDYTAARINLGNTLLAAGRTNEAVAQLELARQIGSNDPQVHHALGLALARAGRVPEAATAFEQSLRLDPDNAEVHNDLGNVLGELGRDAESIAQYRRALQLDANSAEAHFNLALALRGESDGSEAVAHYQASLRLAPDKAEIWNSFGSFLYRLQRLSDAAIAFREAIRLQPDVPQFHNNLGSTLIEMHRFEESIVPLRRAVALAPDYGDAHYNLGVALQSAGHTHEAEVEFKSAGKKIP